MAEPTGRRRKPWGWGYADEQPAPAELTDTARFLVQHLGYGDPQPQAAAPVPSLPAPEIQPPDSLRDVCSTADADRMRHSLGSSYIDVVRGFRGEVPHPVDLVVRPRTESEVEAALEWAAGAGAAVIPYGGGTSVVGGVEPRLPGPFSAVVSLDISALAGVRDVDPISGAARIGAGTTGPALESELGTHGLTLRHYPQSFAFSTLGGWIATRAAGHFSTLLTHIDDQLESVRAITPAGAWESRRLPGSGAGISPDRMLIGSEGILGVITEAWVRVRPRPQQRRSAAVRFPSLATGAEAVRELSQSGLHPESCRLIDPLEARLTGAGDGRQALLVLGCESAAVEVDSRIDASLAICRRHGGEWDGVSGGKEPSGEAQRSWREAFLRAPYLRDTFVAIGVLSETFETAITWERFPAFHQAVTEATEAAVREACGAGTVTCRFTHVYPDGPAPYFTVLAPVQRGAEVETWQRIKAAAAEAILAAGGTITHHHAVGRDHRPWYDRQRPGPFAVALQAAKAALDPTGMLNPGVLIDPRSSG
jgi:alkyldihydroxyacetonephosphate synthase